MYREKWLESVYSDGSRYFVSDPQPKLGQEVSVYIRMYEDNPVKHVVVRTCPNGGEMLIEAHICKKEHGLVWYEASFIMYEARMHYQFYLVCSDVVYYYNQKEITTYIPDHTYDFVLLADYHQPEWVRSSVFYQIFPERFCNGNSNNDVKDNEYQVNGHGTIHMNWEDTPLQYEKGFCMDFYGGDLEGVKEKIPYLKQLGVTCVYLNPIFEAPSVHKYDCIDYFHVDKHFGGDEALAELSRQLHENGMKLILDISINHTGMAHKWFNRDGLYFDKSIGAYNNPESPERSYYFFEEGTNNYKGWANVASLPVLNYTSQQLREVIYESEDSVLKKWLKEPYCIDGWRFDVADVFARNNEIQLNHEIWPQINKSIKEENPDAYILAEDWGDCAEYLQGKEWDSPMNYFGCGRVLRQFVGLADLFNERCNVLRGVNYKMTAEDVKGRIEEHLSKIPFAFQLNQFNLIDSHDVARVHNYDFVSKDAYRGAVMLQFMLPGAPSIYYGDEIEIDGWVQNNEGCRFPMPWNKDFDNNETFKFYQQLTHLKQESAAMKESGMKFLYAKGRTIAVSRSDDKEAIVCVMSMEEEPVEIALPLRSIGAKLPENHKDYFGEELPIIENGEDVILKVPSEKAYLIRCPLL